MSCSHIESGKYVYVSNQNDLDKIIKEYNLNNKNLKKFPHSQNKESGHWVFIPMNPGLLENYQRIQIGAVDLLWPVPASKTISSEFGERWGKEHEGIDIPAKEGAHIVAANDGKVVFSGNGLKSYGNMIIIKHPGNFFTVYAHAQKLHVEKGEKVSRGQVIAKVGTTGRSTGPHLHFELRKNSDAIDPKKFLSTNF